MVAVSLSSRSHRRRGVALVIVLAFVVLLTGVIIAYFSRAMNNRQLSSSSFNQAGSDELARSALDVVVSDIEQEIVNGSNATTGLNATSTSPTIYIPAEPAYSIPVPNGTPAPVNGISPIPTLIRISWPTAIPTPGVDHLASNAPSTALSANGRSVSLQRWNAHYLIPRATPAASTTDSTPVSSFNAPNWVYVNNTGPAVPALKAPSSSVVGRYAYAVYNEGALLDMNVAGFPFNGSDGQVVMPASSPNPGPTPANQMKPYGYAGKGSVAFADLTQLTDSSGNPLLNSEAIGDIAGWRNYASAQPSGTFPIFSLTPSNAASFFDSILNNKNGFLQVTVPTTASSTAPTDQGFVTRQQLLGLQQSILQADNKAVFSVDALPFLGTFSRTINAPAWRPLQDSNNIPGYVGGTNNGTAVVAYNTNATNYDKGQSLVGTNFDLANVRFANAGKITHYMDDTTTATYMVLAGDPLLTTRFSLAKINWLSQADPVGGTGPNTTYAQAIQSCFGLHWGVVGTQANGGNACWSYYGSTGTVAVGTIETLDKVAQEGREPNFFELLKAAILSGSLGVNPGPAGWSNRTQAEIALGTNYDGVSPAVRAGADGGYSYSFDAGTSPSILAPALIPDIQIMQIGANIIDQFDADSYPTAIYFPYPQIAGTSYDAKSLTLVSSTYAYGPMDIVYGDENLPYLDAIVLVTCTIDGKPAPNPGTGTTAGVAAWWQPELWNPHQYPNSANSSVSPPATFMLRANGTAKVDRLGGAPPYPQNYTTAENLRTQTITFTDPAPATSTFYDCPKLLTTTDAKNVTTSVSTMVGTSQMFDYPNNPFVGFYLGLDDSYTGAAEGTSVEMIETTSAPVGFCLGWVSPTNGAFHPYSFLPGIFADPYSVMNQNGFSGGLNDPQGDASPAPSIAEYHDTADPRTIRFSSLGEWGWGAPRTFMSNYGVSASGAISNVQYNRQSDTHGYGQPIAANFAWNNTGPAEGSGYPGDWNFNQKSSPVLPAGTPDYYIDLDGVLRPGDGVNGTVLTYDGLMDVVNNGNPSGSPQAPSDKGANDVHGRRPIILNRPFRSVGELGYAFRDMPFKTLDFSSPSSADAALLDVFSVSDETQVVGNVVRSVVAGQVSLNYAPSQVLQAILMGGLEKDLDTATTSTPYSLSTTDVPAIAKQLAVQLNSTSGATTPTAGITPYVTNRADLPALLNYAINQAFPITASSSYGNKAYREAPLRALADVTNTRTWNLLIDIVAQPGVFSPSAPATAAALNSGFIVQGESRYWLHVAIDRYTGKVVDQQLERVYE
jgi:hypothetical protein